MQVTKIKDDIYGAEVRLITNCTPKQYSAYIKRCFGAEHEPPYQGYFVVYDNGSRQVYLVWIKQFEWRIHDYALLAHELFHCAVRVMDDQGISLSDSSEEAYAYYLQFIYAECISGLKEKLK